MSSIVVGAGDRAVNKVLVLPSWSLLTIHTLNKYVRSYMPNGNKSDEQ